ncbi:MAG: hypothetical protein J6F30_17895 [Cellulosilyticum sp.]|nr:hypothetical protein [Cellulosilyticum sp.]
MDEVIAILIQDEVLKRLGIKIYHESERPSIQECLVYDFYNIQDNGIKAIDTLNITCIAFDLDKSLAIIEQVKRLLITIGDNPLSNKIIKVTQNGGGYISNKMTNQTIHHQKAIFHITRRVNR